MSSRRSTTQTFKAVLAAGALALCAAAPASADSIAYIKDGNVHLATPDGTRQQQVTTTGGYHYVSQADDGTMVALTGRERLHKLSRTGEVLADIATYVSDGAPTPGPVNQFAGPFNPEISPDGSKVAFEWYNSSYSNGSGCNAGSVPPCSVLTSRQGVGVTDSGSFTGFEKYGLKTGWIWPSWVSNSRIVRSDPSVSYNVDAVFDDIAPGTDTLDRWLHMPGLGGLQEVELSRDAKIGISIFGFNDDKLGIFRTLVSPFGAPDPDLSPWAPPQPALVEGCSGFVNPEGGKFRSLSLSPDGRHLAYEVGNGIWAVDIPDHSAGCATPTRNALVIPGGRYPDWGPADIPPTSAYERKSVVVAPPAPAPGLKPTPVPQDLRDWDRKQGALELKVGPKKLAAALRSGLGITVRAPGAGRLSAAGTVRGRKVAAGTARVGASGSATVTVRFTKAGRKRLRRARTASVVLKVTFTPASGAPTTQATTVAMKR